MGLFGRWWGYCLRWWPVNVLQTLGMEELCRQPLEVPLSVGGEWVAQLLAQGDQKTATIKSVTQHLLWFIYVLHFSLWEWPWAAQDECCMSQGCWGRCPIPRHPQFIPQAEKCIVLWWEACKVEPSFLIPSVESMGGKNPQYFLGMGMSSRNRLWEGALAWTEQQIALVFYFLLLVIIMILHLTHTPPYTIKIWCLATCQPSSFCAGAGLIQGKIPLPWRNRSKKQFPWVCSIIHCYPPLGPPWTISFPSPPLHVHPSNGFRIWHWKIKFKKIHQIPKALKTFKYIAQLFPPCTIVLGGLAQDQTSFLLPIFTIPLGIEK